MSRTESRGKPFPRPPGPHPTAESPILKATQDPVPPRPIYFHDWENVNVYADPFGPILPPSTTSPSLSNKKEGTGFSFLPVKRSRARLPGEPPRGAPVGELRSPREDLCKKVAQEATRMKRIKEAARLLRERFVRPKPSQNAHHQPTPRIHVISNIQICPPRPPGGMEASKSIRPKPQSPINTPTGNYPDETSIADAIIDWPDRHSWPQGLKEAVAKLRPMSIPASKRYRRRLITSTGRPVYINIW